MLDLIKSRNLHLNDEIYRQSAWVKEKCRTVSNSILSEMMQKTEVIAVATNLLEILNHMERIAGYVTNITESVIFAVEGEIVKHRKNL
jgi:phosphate transport system protein